jgi:hypothetical protein
MQPSFGTVTVGAGVIVSALLLGESIYQQLLLVENPAAIAAVLVMTWYMIYAATMFSRAINARRMKAKIEQQGNEIDGLMNTISHEAPAERHAIPLKMRRFVLKRDNYICLYCGERGTETRDPDGRTWHIDHLHPVSKGGINHPANLAAACSQCNFSKGNRSAAAFFRIKTAQVRAARYTTRDT